MSTEQAPHQARTIAERANAMRADGATYKEIKAELGVGSGTLAKLLGTAGTGSSSRRIPPDVREKARELRRQGRSVPEISNELGMARSTAFHITKGIAWELSPAEVERRREQAREYWRKQNRRRSSAKDAVQTQAVSEVGNIRDRELLLVGAVLYWAEGAKSKPWRKNDEYLRFINSDPDVIRTYLAWLNLLGVERGRIRYRVMIHESADVAGAERYWAGVVGVTHEEFGRSTLKRHNPKTVRKNIGPTYRGCLIVRVSTSTEEYWRMEAVWRGIVSSVANHVGHLQQET